MNTVARLLLVICACAIAHAFASGFDSNAVEEEPDQQPSPSSSAASPGALTPSKVETPSASSTTTSGATAPQPSSGGKADAGTQQGNSGASPVALASDTKPARVVLVDDTVTDEQLKQILAKGYKPESQARGNEVLYCRRERPLGTRFETKICKTSRRILQDELQGKEMTTRAQRPGGDPAK